MQVVGAVLGGGVGALLVVAQLGGEVGASHSRSGSRIYPLSFP